MDGLKRLLLLGILLATGCGPVHEIRNGYTRVSFKRAPALQNFSANASFVLDGGLMIYAVALDFDFSQAIYMADEDDDENAFMVLPNGEYVFYAIGWPSLDMTGNPYCGSGGDDELIYELDGGAEVVVGFFMDDTTSGNCVDYLPFQDGSYVNGGLLMNLQLHSCAAHNDTCVGNCSSGVGSIGSVEIETYQVLRLDDEILASDDGNFSACLPYAGGTAGFDTGVKVPAGNFDPDIPDAVAVRFWTYTDGACNTPYDVYDFPRGLDNLEDGFVCPNAGVTRVFLND